MVPKSLTREGFSKLSRIITIYFYNRTKWNNKLGIMQKPIQAVI